MKSILIDMHESYKKWLEDGQPKIFCGCGCGVEIEIKKRYKKYGIAKYIRGHYIRSDEEKRLISERMKGENNPFYNKCHTDETKKKISNIAKITHNTKEFHDKASKSHKGVLRTQESKDKHRKTVLEQMKLLSKEEKSKKFGNHGRDNPMFGKPSPYRAGGGHGSYYNSPFQGEIWLRSSYEIAYAKYLDSKSILWYYEYKTFDLGDTTYTPDFYLINDNKYIEIKGWMIPKFQDKINKFLVKYQYSLEILDRNALKKLGVING